MPACDALQLRAFHANSIRVELTIQVRALHAKGIRGAADIAAELAQLREDVLFLERVARLPERQLRVDGQDIPARPELDVLRLDGVRLRQDGHALDDVAQLAHVARP